MNALPMTPVRAPKPTLATCSLTGCFGCHMSLLDIDERILELVDLVDLDVSPFDDKKAFDRPVDVGFIEGGCSNEYNVRELNEFRKHCRILVAVGACAINGGVPAMRNTVGLRECLEAVYLHGASLEGGGMIPDDEDLPLLLDRVYPSHEVVKIDYFLPGCPPSGDAIWEGLKALLTGGVPVLPYLLCKYDDPQLGRTDAMSEAQVLSGPRKIVIDPVTRVEGHGKVTIRLDAQGEVEQARFHIVEFRGFERFIQGRMYWEVPVIVQRLCGICPVSHHLCAAKAMDVVAGVDKVTPTAEKMRRLMHYGQVLQSNAVNFFHLASPDLLLGFEAPVAKRNIVGVIEAFPEVGKWAIFIRKFGQQVIAATGGRRIHPRLCIPGGVNQNLSFEHRDALRQDIDQIIAWCGEALEMHKGFVAADPHRQQTFASFPSNYMSITGPDGAMDLYDGDLRAIDARGEPILEGVHPADYRDHIVEEVRSWSYMKFPHIRSLGPEHGWYRVGPLAQLNCCAFIGTPLAEAARKDFMLQGHGGPVHATLAYHWARMITMIHCAEVIKALLFDDDLQGSDLVVTGERREEGVAIIEAPRGTLIHHYRVDAHDQVTMANLIVSTTNNNEAMNRSVTKVAIDDLSGHEITEGLLNHIEVAIRAYDPCLSCATHALGDMPLIVTLEDAEGETIATRVKQ